MCFIISLFKHSFVGISKMCAFVCARARARAFARACVCVCVCVCGGGGGGRVFSANYAILNYVSCFLCICRDTLVNIFYSILTSDLRR